MLHGLEALEDGSVVVTFDAGRAIARLDACGSPLWVTRGNFHHSIAADGEGGLWAWRDETIVRLDAASGAETRTLDLRSQIMTAAGGQDGVFAIRSFVAGPDKPLDFPSDPFHANDVEPLRPEMAAAFPEFRAGDLLVSLREANLVAVIDPDDGTLRWWQNGPWLKQHDPTSSPTARSPSTTTTPARASRASCASTPRPAPSRRSLPGPRRRPSTAGSAASTRCWRTATCS